MLGILVEHGHVSLSYHCMLGINVEHWPRLSSLFLYIGHSSSIGSTVIFLVPDTHISVWLIFSLLKRWHLSVLWPVKGLINWLLLLFCWVHSRHHIFWWPGHYFAHLFFYFNFIIDLLENPCYCDLHKVSFCYLPSTWIFLASRLRSSLTVCVCVVCDI